MSFYEKHGKHLMLEDNLTQKDAMQPFLNYDGKIYLCANMEENNGELLGFIRLTSKKQTDNLSMFYQKDVTKELSYKTIKTVQNHLKPYFDEIDNYIDNLNKKVKSHSDDMNAIYGIFGFEYLPLTEIRKTIKGTDKILKMIDEILEPLVLKIIADNGGLKIKKDTKEDKLLLLKEIENTLSHNDSIVDGFVQNLRIKLVEEFSDNYSFNLRSTKKLKKIVINQLIQQRKPFLRLIAIQYSLTTSVEQREENIKKLASALVSRKIMQPIKSSWEALKVNYPTDYVGEKLDGILSQWLSTPLSDKLSKEHKKLICHVAFKDNDKIGGRGSNQDLIRIIDNPDKAFTESFEYLDKEVSESFVPVEIFTKDNELFRSIESSLLVEIKLLKINDSLKDDLNKMVISHFNESKQKLDELINNVYLKHATKFNLLNFVGKYEIAHVRTEISERNMQDEFLD